MVCFQLDSKKCHLNALQRGRKYCPIETNTFCQLFYFFETLQLFSAGLLNRRNWTSQPKMWNWFWKARNHESREYFTRFVAAKLLLYGDISFSSIVLCISVTEVVKISVFTVTSRGIVRKCKDYIWFRLYCFQICLMPFMSVTYLYEWSAWTCSI